MIFGGESRPQTVSMGDIPRLPHGLKAKADRRSAQVIQIESSKLIPVLLLFSLFSCFISGVAIGVAMWAKLESSRAQTRADLLQVEVESFKNVLHAYNLPTTAHLKGESP